MEYNIKKLNKWSVRQKVQFIFKNDNNQMFIVYNANQNKRAFRIDSLFIVSN